MTMKTKNDGVEAAGLAGGSSPAAATVPGARPVADERLEKAGKRSKRKAARLRSVWISFTGRIVAQFVGSAASIILGMGLIHGYKAPVQGPEKASLAREPVLSQGRVARTIETAGRHRLSIVVLPIDDFSPAVPGDLFAPALTELVTASLAERGSLVVLSRTSASRIVKGKLTVPAIASELGVDLVLEASVTRSANRVRVVAQVIDGRSDEHLWTGRYDRQIGDILGLQGEIADQIARGIDAVVSGSAPRPSTMASRSASAGIGAVLAAQADVVLHAEPLGRVQEP
jgi:TolB-like protein